MYCVVAACAHLQVQQAVLAALAQLHQVSVLHGDIFEDNFMVEERPGEAPRVTVLDLERAHLSDDDVAFQREQAELKSMLGLTPRRAPRG